MGDQEAVGEEGGSGWVWGEGSEGGHWDGLALSVLLERNFLSKFGFPEPSKC